MENFNLPSKFLVTYIQLLIVVGMLYTFFPQVIVDIGEQTLIMFLVLVSILSATCLLYVIIRRYKKMKTIKKILSSMLSDLLGPFILVLGMVMITIIVSPVIAVAVKPYIENASLRRENASLSKEQSWYQNELRKSIIPDTTNIGNRRDYSKFKVK